MEKRKAPSASSMQKALATFKARHPGAPIPGFLRKYAKNPVRPLKLRSSTKHSMQHTRAATNPKKRKRSGVMKSVTRNRKPVSRQAWADSGFRRNPKGDAVNSKNWPFVIQESSSADGPWKTIARSRHMADAKFIAYAIGEQGGHARVQK